MKVHIMKRVKYFLVLLLAVSLIFVAIPIFPVIAAGPTISISSPATVTEGETFVVDVNITGVTNLTSWQYAITYNPAVIRVIGSEGGAEGVTPGLMNGTTVTPISMWQFSPAATQGAVIILQWIPIQQPVSGSGYLAQVHFQALPGTAGQSSSINFVDLPAATPPFSRGLWNNTSSPITDVTWNNGSVSIAANALLPSVTSLVPNTGLVGTTLTAVQINGTKLTGATAVNFSGSGVTASNIIVVSTTQIKADITINGAAVLGARDVTVTTPGGTSAALVGGFTVKVNVATNLTVTGITTPRIAGTASNVVVTAKDAYGNTATGYTGTIHFTATDAAAVLPANYTFVAGDNGVHTFTGGVTLKTAGSRTVTATDTVTASITGTSANITVNPGAAATLSVSGITDPIIKGTTSDVVVTAKDAYGNTATGYTGTIHFTATDAAAVLPANYTFVVGDNGTRTFTAGVKLNTYGEQSVTATDTITATITGSQTAITVNPVVTKTYALNSDWNLFSVPFPLEDGYRTWGQVKSLSGGINATIAMYYDPTNYVNEVWQPWCIVTDSYTLTPCDAIYILMPASGSISLRANTNPALPSKSLSTGWNLVGLGYYAEGQTGMSVKDALISVYAATGAAATGYTQVLSPALNQPGWFYIRDNPSGGAVPEMLIAKGYWVFMVNPGTLAGFTATPLP